MDVCCCLRDAYNMSFIWSTWPILFFSSSWILVICWNGYSDSLLLNLCLILPYSPINYYFHNFIFQKTKPWIGLWHYFSCLRIAFNYVDGEFHLQSSKSLFVHVPSPGGPDNHVHDEAFQWEAAPHKASGPVAPLPPLSPLQLHLCWPPSLAGPHVILYHYWLF